MEPLPGPVDPHYQSNASSEAALPKTYALTPPVDLQTPSPKGTLLGKRICFAFA